MNMNCTERRKLIRAALVRAIEALDDGCEPSAFVCDRDSFTEMYMTPESAQAEYEESVGKMEDGYLDPPFWGVCVVVQEAEG